MFFKQAFEAIKQGALIKLPEWTGYWKWEDNSIKMHCKDGRVLDIRETENVLYTFTGINSDQWEVIGDTIPTDLNIQTFAFGEAIRNLKNGYKVARKGWNGKNMFIVYQKGYPQGIPSNKQTAIAWGINEGDLFKCEPYLQIQMVNGSHSMWVPSINDCLAEDWQIVE